MIISSHNEDFMQPPQFLVEDRVRTIQPCLALPVRRSGTIYRVTRAGNFYGVLFDGVAMIRVIHYSYLEQGSPSGAHSWRA